MAAKILALFVIAAALTQAHGLTQIILADESYSFMTNDLIGKSLTIPKFLFDTLLLCEVVFPDGRPYEVYPNNRLPPGPISFLYAVQPFTSCSIGFLGASVSHSGTYELSSTVRHVADNSLSVTIQRFHLTLFESSYTNEKIEESA